MDRGDVVVIEWNKESLLKGNENKRIDKREREEHEETRRFR